MSLNYYGDMSVLDKWAIGPLHDQTPVDTKKITQQLVKAGLPQHQIDILLDRFVDNLTFKEIADRRHFVGVKVAYTEYRKALEVVRKRGGSQ